MAEGALNQMNPAATIAGGGDSMQTQLFQQMMESGQKKQSYLEQQQAAYNADMEKYAQMVQQSQQPDSREAQMWGSMAGAAANVAPTWGNIGAMLGKTGEAYGNFQAQDQALNLKNQADLTKMRQAEVRALEGKDQQAAMLKALYGGNKGLNPVIKVVDGKLVKYDPISDTTTVLSGSQDQIKKDLFKTFYQSAVKNEMSDPEAYAQAQVEKTLAQFGGTVVTGKDTGIPGTRSVTQPEVAPVINEQPLGLGERQGGAGTVDIAGPLAGALTPEDSALASRLISRINANPAAAVNDTARLEKLLAKYQNGQPSTAVPGAQASTSAPSAQTPPLTYLDRQKQKEQEGYGAGIGKHMADTMVDLQKTGTAAKSLIGDLNTLEALYKEHGDTVPEGAAGQVINTVKSGLKSFGVDVKGQGANDMINAIATKQALKARTADGENMLPGAMSNYEDRLLQSMSPGLLMTQEGRLLAIQVAKAQMQMRVDLAEAAREYRRTHKSLDEGWFSVAAEIGNKNPFLDEKRIKALETYAKTLNGGKK